MDVIAGRCLLQPAEGCDGCGAGDAAKSGRGRQSEDYTAANGYGPGLGYRDRAYRSGCGLRSGIRSVAGLRISGGGMAGMVSVPWNLVWRAVSFIRTWVRNRVVWRVWMGMGSLGIRLALPLREVQRRGGVLRVLD